jgi:predicted small secreted protein
MMKRCIKLALSLVLLALLAAPLSACNTMEGLGRDAKAAGEAITGAASDSKGY